MIYSDVRAVVLGLILCYAFESLSANEHVPNTSNTDGVSCQAGEDGECTGYANQKGQNSKEKQKWEPFRLKSKQKWISFDRVVGKYTEWHKRALTDIDVPCEERKVLVFTPSAGLGDSIGALTAAFMYALRTGRLFFIDWKPFPWSVTFKDLPFTYDYEKALKLSSNSSGKSVICPDKEDETSFLTGHITNQHPIVAEATGYEFHTEYDKTVEFFINPSRKVQAMVDSVAQQYFSDAEDDVILHKVALVMRTGIGEYNQFLSIGDETNFVTCFLNYARNFIEKQTNNGVELKPIKFAVLVTSDNDDAKRNAIAALRKEADKEELDIDVVTLEDSAVHIMHMTPDESKLKRVRAKLRKTIAEFFLISMCDARFLTHGSLFGRTAAERGRGQEQDNYFISDSHCDGKRAKYSYLQCHTPKYPLICGLQ